MGSGGLKYDPVTKEFVPLTEASAVPDALPAEEATREAFFEEADEPEFHEPIRPPAPVELTGQQPVFYYWMGIAVLLTAWFLFMAGFLLRPASDPRAGHERSGERPESSLYGRSAY